MASKCFYFNAACSLKLFIEKKKDKLKQDDKPSTNLKSQEIHMLISKKNSQPC